MNKFLWLLLLASLCCVSGCKAFRDTFNEPERKPVVKKSTARRSQIFPWSKSEPLPSSIDSALSKREQELLNQYRNDNNMSAPNRLDNPKKDTRKWVFGY